MILDADIKKLERNYVPKDFKLTDWQTLEPFFKELVNRQINSRENLEQWLKDMSEVEAVVTATVPMMMRVE
jgi:oligoendopeptidase F